MKSIFNAVIKYAFLNSHFPMFICLWVLPSSTCSSWLQKSKRYLYGSRMKIKNCLFVSLLQFFQFPYNFLNKQQTRLVLCNNTCSCWLPFYMEQFILFHIFFFSFWIFPCLFTCTTYWASVCAFVQVWEPSSKNLN